MGTKKGRWKERAIVLAAFSALACGLEPADLVVANGPDVQNLDPHRATTSPDGRVMRALTAGLTRLDPATLRPEPCLAEAWTVSTDATQWRFRLRGDLEWSDGSPLGADDFVRSWLRLAGPGSGSAYAAWLDAIEGVAAWRTGGPVPAGLQNDGGDLVVQFTRPVPFFAEMCAYHVLAPIPEALANAKPGESLEAFPTSGPYRLVERRIRDRVRVERNPHWWDAANVALETIDFLTVESQFTALNLFLAGDADYLSDVPNLALAALTERESVRAAEATANGVATPRPEFAPSPYLGTYFYRFNTTRPPLDDARVRRALALSIDREELAASIGAGQPAAWSLVPPWIENYDPPADVVFDPTRARELLAEAGYPNGEGLRRLEMLFNTSEAHRDVAEVLQDQWKRHLGIEVALANAENKIVIRQQNQLEYDLSRSSWVADFGDPENFLEVFRGGAGDNRTGWQAAEYDALLDRALGSSDFAERAQLYRQAEELLLEDAPILPLYFYLNVDLMAGHVQGYHRNPRGYVDWSRLSE